VERRTKGRQAGQEAGVEEEALHRPIGSAAAAHCRAKAERRGPRRAVEEEEEEPRPPADRPSGWAAVAVEAAVRVLALVAHPRALPGPPALTGPYQTGWPGPACGCQTGWPALAYGQNVRRRRHAAMA
jgi:hypothetical protein